MHTFVRSGGWRWRAVSIRRHAAGRLLHIWKALWGDNAGSRSGLLEAPPAEVQPGYDWTTIQHAPKSGHMQYLKDQTGTRSMLINRVLPLWAGLVGLVLIFGWLGGDHLVGDEHNAIHFLKSGFWDYMKSFHYGHTLKAQVWVIHSLFGNSFFWYRVPAAVAIACFVFWLAFFRKDDLPVDRITQALVVLFVISNMRLLFFARWGMPNYGESILLEALLLGMLMPDVIAGRMPAWTKWRLLVMAVLPWFYPTTVILLGAVSTWFWLLVLLSAFVPGVITANGNFVRRMFSAAVPLLVGGLSLVAYRLSVPDAHWNRARGLHSSFSDWVGRGEGGMASFMLHSLRQVGTDILGFVQVMDGATVLAQVHRWLGVSVAVAIVAALAIAVYRVSWLRGAAMKADRAFLRAGGFLAVSVLASIAVVLAAQVRDAFPLGGLRHTFFLIPPLALLAVVSTAYLVHLVSAVAGQWTRTSARVLGSIAVLVLGGFVAVVVSQDRAAADERWRALFAVFHSPANDITFSFSPGFYISSSLQPAPKSYFMIDAGKNVPGAVRDAVRRQSEAGGGRMAVLVRKDAVSDARSGLNAFIAENRLHVEQIARSGAFAALALTIPKDLPARASREIEFNIELPRSAIASVRLDPTQLTQAKVAVESIVLSEADGKHVIDVCSDTKLQMVRTVRVDADAGSGCTLVLGNATNAGWIAPSALRNLGPSADKRGLQVRMRGEFSDEFRIYFDLGNGYNSSVRINIRGGE